MIQFSQISLSASLDVFLVCLNGFKTPKMEVAPVVDSGQIFGLMEQVDICRISVNDRKKFVSEAELRRRENCFS